MRRCRQAEAEAEPEAGQHDTDGPEREPAKGQAEMLDGRDEEQNADHAHGRLLGWALLVVPRGIRGRVEAKRIRFVTKKLHGAQL